MTEMLPQTDFSHSLSTTVQTRELRTDQFVDVVWQLHVGHQPCYKLYTGHGLTEKSPLAVVLYIMRLPTVYLVCSLMETDW